MDDWEVELLKRLEAEIAVLRAEGARLRDRVAGIVRCTGCNNISQSLTLGSGMSWTCAVCAGSEAP